MEDQEADLLLTDYWYLKAEYDGFRAYFERRTKPADFVEKYELADAWNDGNNDAERVDRAARHTTREAVAKLVREEFGRVARELKSVDDLNDTE